VALAVFGLVLVLARRLRALTERVNVFFPVVEGTLPLPGTPVPEFDAVATDGAQVTHSAFAGVERIFAALSTGCGSCLEQVSAFRELGASLTPQPIVAVVGPARDRAPMVTQLDGRAIIIEEPEHGPVVEAFEVSEFPAVLLVRDGVIQLAEHGLASVLSPLAPAAAAASADSRRQG
jgi:hypothetical protein